MFFSKKLLVTFIAGILVSLQALADVSCDDETSSVKLEITSLAGEKVAAVFTSRERIDKPESEVVFTKAVFDFERPVTVIYRANVTKTVIREHEQDATIGGIPLKDIKSWKLSYSSQGRGQHFYAPLFFYLKNGKEIKIYPLCVSN